MPNKVDNVGGEFDGAGQQIDDAIQRAIDAFWARAKISSRGSVLVLWDFWKALGLFDLAVPPLVAPDPGLAAHQGRPAPRGGGSSSHGRAPGGGPTRGLGGHLPLDAAPPRLSRRAQGPAQRRGRVAATALRPGSRGQVGRRAGLAEGRVLYLYGGEAAMGRDFMPYSPAEEADPGFISIFGIRFNRPVEDDMRLPMAVALDGRNEIPLAAGAADPAAFWEDVDGMWAGRRQDRTAQDGDGAVKLICFPMAFARTPFFGACPYVGSVGAARPLLVAVRDVRGQVLLGILTGNGDAPEADRPTQTEADLLAAVGRRELRADPPWRALKSDLKVEDFCYPWDQGRSVIGKVDDGQPPSRAPFDVERTGLAVHAETHLSVYAVLRCMRAAVPATGRMTLRTLASRLGFLHAWTTDPARKRIELTRSDGELGEWLDLFKKQIAALRPDRSQATG